MYSDNIAKELNAVEQVPSGLFDGLTFFRFAHMGRQPSSGGVEAYLWNLNRSLLERHALRILQMYIVQEGEPTAIEVEKIGRGELVWIPSILRAGAEARPGIAGRVWAKLSGGRGYRLAVNHDMFLDSLAGCRPTLGVFHWISEDSQTVINYLAAKDIPFAVIHHFHNEKLKVCMVSRQVAKAQAVAGVSEADLPDFLNNRFTNIADGIDTDFFHPQAALPLDIKLDAPVIFLPARICAEKGHLDAVRALVLLARSGVKALLAFAGYQESQVFTDQLKRLIAEQGVQERVIFVGELRPPALRDWYAASAIVVLPTYHAEGLPRVLLEAQAMAKPVLAYDSGGTREAFREGVGGLLLEKGDIAGLANRLQDLLEDEDRLRAMGQRGREFVAERFSLDALVIRHEKFYADILKRK